MGVRLRPTTLLLVIFLTPIALLAQSGRMDVASVKPNTSGDASYRWTFENGRFTGSYVTLKTLVSTAYGPPQQPLPDFQIAGGDSWVGTERFDVVASGTAGGSLSALLQQLIADRFAVTARFERREMPVYALVIARKDGVVGPKMTRTTEDCAAIAAGRAAGERCGGQIVPGHVVAHGITMPQMVSGLARLMPNVGRPVVDQTGLTGSFDIELTWTPDQPVANTMPNIPVPPVDPNGPALFTALQEQLGLKLDSGRGPVEVLVIESARHPQPD